MGGSLYRKYGFFEKHLWQFCWWLTAKLEAHGEKKWDEMMDTQWDKLEAEMVANADRVANGGE